MTTFMNSEDRMEDGRAWITTYSGRQFFFAEATPDDIYTEDIAHALSNVCRFVGHCRVFYSVAEHSVRMSEMTASPHLKLLALLHDASEAYIGDVTTWLKCMLPEYKKLEDRLSRQIHLRYGIDLSTLSSGAKLFLECADETMVRREVGSLFFRHDGWGLDPVTRHYRDKIKPWTAAEAEDKFLEAFNQVYKSVYKSI